MGTVFEGEFVVSVRLVQKSVRRNPKVNHTRLKAHLFPNHAPDLHGQFWEAHKLLQILCQLYTSLWYVVIGSGYRMGLEAVGRHVKCPSFYLERCEGDEAKINGGDCGGADGVLHLSGESSLVR